MLSALRSGWIAPLGPDVDAFEAEIAERIGVRRALALSSGTAALHLALLELGAGPGRVVILPSMTFAASANAVTYTGAKPVFVDAASDDGNIDVDLLEQAIKTLLAEGSDICAVMSVDLFGSPCDYSRIVPLLEHHGIPLVEDAAEALGATYRGQAAGSFGRVAALSFNGNKIMTTSGGGMLLGDDDDLIDHARKLSTQSREPVPWYEHAETGYNYRMSNILAALGRGQLTRLDEMVARRRQIRDQYRRAFSDVSGVRFLCSPHPAEGNGWLTCIVLDDQIYPDGSDGVLSQLNATDIEARHLWKPMHLQPLFRDARRFETGVCETLFRQGITLPSGSGLSDQDVDRVVDVLIQELQDSAVSQGAGSHR